MTKKITHKQCKWSLVIPMIVPSQIILLILSGWPGVPGAIAVRRAGEEKEVEIELVAPFYMEERTPVYHWLMDLRVKTAHRNPVQVNYLQIYTVIISKYTAMCYTYFNILQSMGTGMPGVVGHLVIMEIWLQLVVGIETVMNHCTEETIPASHWQMQMKQSPVQVSAYIIL